MHRDALGWKIRTIAVIGAQVVMALEPNVMAMALVPMHAVEVRGEAPVVIVQVSVAPRDLEEALAAARDVLMAQGLAVVTIGEMVRHPAMDVPRMMVRDRMGIARLTIETQNTVIAIARPTKREGVMKGRVVVRALLESETSTDDGDPTATTALGHRIMDIGTEAIVGLMLEINAAFGAIMVLECEITADRAVQI